MIALRFFSLFLALMALTGFARKSTLTVRAHVEANGAEGAPFAMPVKFKNPPRDGFMSSVPAISERNITGIYAIRADDGTWGCAFRLNMEGRIAIETLSREHRGSSLVVFIATKIGTHQVIDMVIDKPVNDGILYVPRGMTATEIVVLQKQFKVIGPTGQKPVKTARRGN
ncbi:MAG: hypothetical protein ABI680_06520 [Chthoniobacteraceae bacterium]